MTVRTLSGLREISENFSCYLVDVWGTLHDGTTLFPKIIETLKWLREARKDVYLFSNAPRLEEPLVSYLASMGLGKDLYTGVLTSGIHLRDDCLARAKEKQMIRFYQIGIEVNNVLKDTTFERVFELDQTDFILLTGTVPGWFYPKAYQDIWTQALEKNLPVLCGNSDRYVMIEGNRVLCAGALADMYADQGGEVHWYGKPHTAFYDWALARLGHPPKDHVLAIGDSLSTDIAGANAAGISSLLVYQTGIHAPTFDDPAHQGDPQAALTSLKMGTPTYLMDELRW